MDPITLILTALTAGAAKAAGDAAPDLYKGLKALIQRRFAGKPTAEMVLAEHENDPQTYEAPLKKQLQDAGLDQDEEVLKAAEALLDKLQEGRQGATTITIGEGAKGIIGQNLSNATIIGDIH